MNILKPSEIFFIVHGLLNEETDEQKFQFLVRSVDMAVKWEISRTRTFPFVR